MSATVKTIRIANAPCSWGTLEYELKYGEAAYQEVLAEMARAGYDGTELGDWGFMPTNPAVLKRELLKQDLTLAGAGVQVALSRLDAWEHCTEQVVKLVRLLADSGSIPMLVVSDEVGGNLDRTRLAGRIEQRHQMDESQWQRFIGNLETLARMVLDKTGLRTVFHPHAASFVETPYEIERFLEMSDPDLVGLCFDTGHYALGGGNPVEGFARYADRIEHIHLRDYDLGVIERSHSRQWDYYETLKRGVFREPGEGDLDFEDFFRAVRQSAYQGWVVVEQELSGGLGSPMESAWRSRSFLRRFGL